MQLMYKRHKLNAPIANTKTMASHSEAIDSKCAEQARKRHVLNQ